MTMDEYIALRVEIKQMEDKMYVDAIKHDEQGNIIYDRREQFQRNTKYWKDTEKEYGINYGDVVDFGGSKTRAEKV